jgi:hypothetical protein
VPTCLVSLRSRDTDWAVAESASPRCPSGLLGLGALREITAQRVSPAFTGRNRTGFRAEHERLPQDYELCLIHELFPSLTETASGGHPCCVFQ